MRIQPRQQILDIWRSVVRASFRDGSWTWGGRDEPNSISDAEQLLCLLYPAIQVPGLALDRPNTMAEDVATALEILGPPTAIPRILVDVLADYLDRYSDEHDKPVFAAGSYLRAETSGDGSDAITEAQRAIDVVDSYATSVRLCLATLGFVKLYKYKAARLDKVERVERGFQDRLTGAMIGLRRSLVAPTEPDGECGWAWGIARPDGVADPLPSLYSTVAALDRINELRSDRTHILGLLIDEQRELSKELQLHADQTRRYWASVAQSGADGWLLEDIPWRASDGEESDYFSLLVSAVLLQDLGTRRATDDLNRVARILEELALRGRITRRVTQNDAAVAIHVPGVQLRLGGTTALGPQLYWHMADFAPLLLTCALRSARLAAAASVRDQALGLAEEVMGHLMRRRISHGPAAGLWDDPGEVLFPYEKREPIDQPSWHLTVRVVEALVEAANTLGYPLLRGSRLMSIAQELLSEADHLMNREMLAAAGTESSIGTSLAEVETRLAMARRILPERPGAALALVTDVLRKLDELSGAVTTREASGDLVPVSIHLESDANASAVEHAVLGVLYAFGFVIEEAQAPVAGSWVRVMTAKLKEMFRSGDVLARIERALEMQALDKPQSEIDSAQADAVAKLITALSQDQNAFIQIGSVFLIKVDGVTVVRNLSQREMAFLQRHSGMLAAPQKILHALEEFAASSEGPLGLDKPAADTG